MQSRIPDDAAGAYVFRLKFKLGLDEMCIRDSSVKSFQQREGFRNNFTLSGNEEEMSYYKIRLMAYKGGEMCIRDRWNTAAVFIPAA